MNKLVHLTALFLGFIYLSIGIIAQNEDIGQVTNPNVRIVADKIDIDKKKTIHNMLLKQLKLLDVRQPVNIVTGKQQVKIIIGEIVSKVENNNILNEQNYDDITTYAELKEESYDEMEELKETTEMNKDTQEQIITFNRRQFIYPVVVSPRMSGVIQPKIIMIKYGWRYPVTSWLRVHSRLAPYCGYGRMIGRFYYC